jgi:hypothetical protein
VVIASGLGKGDVLNDEVLSICCHAITSFVSAFYSLFVVVRWNSFCLIFDSIYALWGSNRL